MRWIESTFGRIALPGFALLAFYLTLFGWPRFSAAFRSDANQPLTGARARRLNDLSAELLHEQRYQQALAPTLALHHAWPTMHIYIGRLAVIYDHLHRYKDEASAWEEFLDRAPRPIEACPAIGEAYEKQGLEEKAIHAYQRCLKFDPQSSDSIFYLAHALEKHRELSSAAALYQRGITASPTYWDLRIGLARVELRQGRTREALRNIEAVLEREPSNSDALLVAGLTWLEERQLDHARAALEKGARRAPGEAEFWVALGRVAEAEHKDEEAREDYSHALQLDPSNRALAARRDALAGAR